MIIDIVLPDLFGQGGTEVVVSMVSKRLKEKGHRVRVFIGNEVVHKEWEKTVDELYYYCPHINIFQHSIPLSQIVKSYYKLLQEHGYPDVMLATRKPIQSAICYYACHNNLQDKKIPIISWLHGDIHVYGNEELLNFCDAHLSLTTYMATQIKDYSKNPIYLIGNPVDIKRNTQMKRPRKIPQFLYIGRLNNFEKRLDVLLKGLCLCQGDWELKIVGTGPHESILKEYAKQLQIADKIEWLGWQENPWEVINETTLLILTSDTEGFGLVITESLSRGIPVVCTDVGVANDVIKEGENGWIFPRGNHLALASYLTQILSGELTLPSKQQCIDSISRYDIEEYIKLLEKIFEVEKLKKNLDSFML